MDPKRISRSRSAARQCASIADVELALAVVLGVPAIFVEPLLDKLTHRRKLAA